MVSVYYSYFLAKVPPASAGFYVLIFYDMRIQYRKSNSRKYMDCMCIVRFSWNFS